MRIQAILGIMVFGCVLLFSHIYTQQSVEQLPRPGVYLTLEKIGPREPRFHTESREGVWLRLRNATSRPIFIYADLPASSAEERQLSPNMKASFAKDGAEVRACYDVDGIPMRISRTTKDKTGLLKWETEVPHRRTAPAESPYRSCIWGISYNRRSKVPWLGPGESVLFSVPKNFLGEGLRISTMYSYDWEVDDRGYVRSGEPVHLVFYTHNQFEVEKRELETKAKTKESLP